MIFYVYVQCEIGVFYWIALCFCLLRSTTLRKMQGIGGRKQSWCRRLMVEREGLAWSARKPSRGAQGVSIQSVRSFQPLVLWLSRIRRLLYRWMLVSCQSWFAEILTGLADLESQKPLRPCQLLQKQWQAQRNWDCCCSIDLSVRVAYHRRWSHSRRDDCQLLQTSGGLHTWHHSKRHLKGFSEASKACQKIQQRRNRCLIFVVC